MVRIAWVTTWSVLALIAPVLAPGPMVAPAAVALELGKPAPDFSLPNENGEVVTLKQFRGKKIVVLEFFGAAFAPT